MCGGHFALILLFGLCVGIRLVNELFIDPARVGRVLATLTGLIFLFAQFYEHLHDGIKSLVYLANLSIDLLI